jgi:hypothetical protein
VDCRKKGRRVNKTIFISLTIPLVKKILTTITMSSSANLDRRNRYALTPDVLCSFQVGKVFNLKTSNYSLDFDLTGNYCLTSSADEALRIYDCKAGR